MALYQRPPRSDELYHFGRKGMKWYQHIFGPAQSGAKYSKGKSEEKKLDKNSEEYYRNRVKNGKVLTSDEIGYYEQHVYKIPDYSSLNKKERARKQAEYLKDREDRVYDLNFADRDPIRGLEGMSVFNRMQRMGGPHVDPKYSNNKKIVDASEKLYKYRDDWREAFREADWDSKNHKFRNEEAGKRYEELRRKWEKHISDMSGMYLKELGFEDSPETREAIESYWYW